MILDEANFLARFPRPFVVRALTRYEAKRLGLPTDVTQWRYVEPFEFVSQVWGSIVVPAGAVTDFASVPPLLHSLYDDDSPALLFPSAPHDLLFTPRADGSGRGWARDDCRLTLEQSNRVLIEAMEVCGASDLELANVLAAITIANRRIAGEFARP